MLTAPAADPDPASSSASTDAVEAVRVEFARRWAWSFLVAGGLLGLSCAAAAVLIAANAGLTVGFWLSIPLGLVGLLVAGGAFPLLLVRTPVLEASRDGLRIGLGLDHLVPWRAIDGFELTAVRGLPAIVIRAADGSHSALADAGEPGAALGGAFGALAQRLHDDRGVLAVAVVKTSILRGEPRGIVAALEEARRRFG